MDPSKASSMASKHTNLILFTFLSSLPLFLFMIYYEKRVENTLLELLQALTPPPLPYHTIHTHEMYWLKSITSKLFKGFMVLCFLHLLPLHLLTFFSSISTIHLTSTILQTPHQDQPSFTFREFLRSRLKGNFLTSILGLSLSSSALLGFLWLSLQVYTTRVILGHTYRTLIYVQYPMVVFFVYVIAILFILVKMLEMSVVWNMSLVVSVLEGVDGMRAFSLAYCFNRGSENRGLLMMFVFFCLSLGLKILFLFGVVDREVGLVVRASLLWGLHLVKWVACTWYYFGCKNRVLQKKVDFRVGEARKSLA